MRNNQDFQRERYKHKPAFERGHWAGQQANLNLPFPLLTANLPYVFSKEFGKKSHPPQTDILFNIILLNPIWYWGVGGIMDPQNVLKRLGGKS